MSGRATAPPAAATWCSRVQPGGPRSVGRAFDEAKERVGLEWTTHCDACFSQHVAPTGAARTAKGAHLRDAHASAPAANWTWSTDDKPTFHSLRHTFASAVIAGGADQGHVGLTSGLLFDALGRR